MSNHSTTAALAETGLELALRWRNARVAALRTVVPSASADLTEEELLALAWQADAAAVLRRVFDNSLLLGRGFARYHRVDLTLVDQTALLPMLGSPCVASLHRLEDTIASRSDRAPCADVSEARCATWREALHGLVSGLSSSVYYTRVESGAGQGRCRDLLHLEARSDHRYTPVTEEVQNTLQQVRGQLARIAPGTELDVLGLSEGALHVQLRTPSSGCGLNLHVVLERLLARALPGITIKDASPRAVLADGP